MDTTMRLIENSRQGFEGIKAAVCLGSRRVKSNDASGLRRSLRRNGVRNRCQTGLDYFGARYMSAPLGRFISPDPENAGASTDDPQSWNAYAYARNNPLMYTDPDGMRYQVCWDDDGTCHEMSDPDYLTYKANVIDPIGYIAGRGIIYQKDVVGFVQLGTVRYLMSDEMWELMQGTQMAKPFVEAAGIGALLLTGGFVALDWVAASSIIETLGPIVATSAGTVSSVGNRIQAGSLKEFKTLVNRLSRPDSELTLQELRQLERLATQFGGKLRYDLNPIIGKILKPHVQVEGLGSSVSSRHIWLGKGIK